jgi:hypothetical protein
VCWCFEPSLKLLVSWFIVLFHVLIPSWGSLFLGLLFVAVYVSTCNSRFLVLFRWFHASKELLVYWFIELLVF